MLRTFWFFLTVWRAKGHCHCPYTWRWLAEDTVFPPDVAQSLLQASRRIELVKFWCKPSAIDKSIDRGVTSRDFRLPLMVSVEFINHKTVDDADHLRCRRRKACQLSDDSASIVFQVIPTRRRRQPQVSLSISQIGLSVWCPEPSVIVTKATLYTVLYCSRICRAYHCMASGQLTV